MGYINVGTTDQLILELPTDRTTDWGQRFKENFVKPLVDHDHSGNGKGRRLGASALEDGSINGIKILLNNEEYFRARSDAASNLILDVFKVDVTNTLVFELPTSFNNTVTFNSPPILVEKVINQPTTSVVNDATTYNIIDLSSYTTKKIIIDYTLTSSTGDQTGTITSNPVEDSLSIDYIGIDINRTISLNSDIVQISNTAGENLTLRYFIREI